MLNLLGLIYLTAHLLGDYYFQSKNISEKKNKYLLYLLIHLLIYTTVVFAITLPFWSISLIVFNLIFSFIHFAIDLLKHILHKMNRSGFTDKYSAHIYVIDQALHILSILFISALFPLNENSALFQILNFNITGVYSPTVLKWLCLLLFIGKPANITFAKLFARHKPVYGEVESNNKAGATIGILERLIIVTFMSIRQYSAIGLVLTAKSIARYKMISEDREFGEYYLIGTLVSVLSAVTAYLILFY
jgi:hypothetical protein